MKWLKLFGVALGLGLLVAFLPEVLGPGPRADFAIGERLAGGALLVPLALIFVGGIATALTPCVYPLIPITVAVFGASKATSRRQSTALTLTYILGIAVTFTTMGVAAALTGKAFGSALGNVYVVVALALLLVVFAISMFGGFDFNLPSGLQTKLATVGKSGYSGALMMGLVAGLVAAPCTGPVLSGVLLHVATTQNISLGALLLFVYALGLGVPFFLIGALALKLPKAGAWMDLIKSLFGNALLAVAVIYIRDAFPLVREALSLRTVAYGAIIASVLVGLGVLAGALHRSFKVWPSDGLMKGVGVLLVVLGIALRPEAPLAEAKTAFGDWRTSEPVALADAAGSKRPLLIDFFADWCAACKELDRFVYTDPRFADEARRFVLARINGTDETPEIERLYKKYGIQGLPTVIFIDSDGKVHSELTVTGYLEPQEFSALMKKVK